MFLKKVLTFFVCLSSLALHSSLEQNAHDLQLQEQASSDVQIVVQAQKTKKVPLGLVVMGKHDASLDALAERLKIDLEWSGQCKVTMKKKDTLQHVSELKTMFSGDEMLAIFISKTGSEYTWRLYDVMSAEMIVGKKIMQEDKPIALLAHTIADELWPELFGQKSSFRSKIAFCKQIWRTKYGREKPYKQIWIADFDGSNAKLFIDAPTVSFAPRWNNDTSSPLLFYSENTLSNIQLVMSNMFSKRKVICCFDGLNMQPAFSSDGKRVVFCLSKDGTSQLYLTQIDGITQKRKFDRLTFNDGNNIAPCFIDNSHVAFVSDYQTHKPQLYILSLSDGSLQRITDGGYCACPSYSQVRHQLVYSKMIGGAMQLFTYDVKTKEHKQITQGAGSKEEASWSACGNYIVFGLNQGLKSRIAQLNLITNKIHYLTSEHDHCTYPDCSPIYSKNLGILNT
ncbi:MAG TPA: hypothetical protein VLG50_08605 [Candidatus Saccharimonadales bacterium]|nr:hypothetical protein [Candidatus Saccharimonadales bacterium]